MPMSQKKERKPRKRRSTGNKVGRPSREELQRRRILALGVDPLLVDPRRILAAIAIDQEAPANARVSACRTLMASGATPAAQGDASVMATAVEMPADELTRRTLEIMASRGRPN